MEEADHDDDDEMNGSSVGLKKDKEEASSSSMATTNGNSKKNVMMAIDDDDDPNHHSSEHQQLIVTIVSARYAPCEGTLGGENNNNNTADTRDVTPFVRALLLAQKLREAGITNNTMNDDQYYEAAAAAELSHKDALSTLAGVRLNAVVQGQRRAQICVLDDSSSASNNNRTIISMNCYFGDPVPGTSKRLYVEYRIRGRDGGDGASAIVPTVETHSASFAEHERVFLRRNTTDSTITAAASFYEQDDDLSITNRTARGMGRSHQNIDELLHVRQAGRAGKQQVVGPNTTTSTCWKLQTATSEIVLPLVMPFLNFKERVQCRLICSVWRNIVREWGVATTITDNDPSFAHCFSRPFLRGILSHSYTSLQCLFLSGTPNLEPDDLHPAIPNLRKLRSLDISHCINLDDSTLQLLAQHVSGTLQVLYIKGLRRVTDQGVIAIAESCHSLRVLEISNIPVTDRAAMAIGEHLTALRAIYMRDNYLLTNNSIDVITERCTALEQLTLWGCIRMNHLRFIVTDDVIGNNKRDTIFTSSNLVLLNLWGCHSLRDDAALALQGMTQLRSLIVSECHRLSDKYVTSIAQYVPQLQHLHLRYCKKITDKGVNVITQCMQDLYSLDLSFCSKVTIAAIFNLLEIRGGSLAELRIRSCRNLDIAHDPNNAPPIRRGGRQQQYSGGYAGRQILSVLRSLRDTCCLSVLDVRQCTGSSFDGGYPDHDPFVEGMAALHFRQTVPGFFSRPARWNQNVERRLVKQFLSATDRADRFSSMEGNR